MTALFGLSLIGLFCLIGMALRRWIPALRANMVPAFVIAGFLGAIAMNVGLSGVLDGVDHELFTTLTAQLFTLSFISIGLTPPPPSTKGDGGRTQKVLLRGAWAMGLTWTFVFAIQALIGVGVVAATGRFGGMEAMYGFMVPFAFAQGPGQAVTFAGIFEQQGWDDAVNVGLAFASAGFAAAFLVGVPLAKWGMSKGLATHSMGFSDSVGKGYFRKEEETESLGTETTFSGNIDTLTFHFTMMGLAYLLAHGLAWIFGHLPGFVGDTISGMMFMNGLLAAYFLRWVLRKIRVEHMLDRQMQAKLTGFTTDYVVVASFMAVQAAVVVAWLVPILVTVVLAVTAVTVVLCFADRSALRQRPRLRAHHGHVRHSHRHHPHRARPGADPGSAHAHHHHGGDGADEPPRDAVHPSDAHHLRRLRRGARAVGRRRRDGRADCRLFRDHAGHSQLRQAHLDPPGERRRRVRTGTGAVRRLLTRPRPAPPCPPRTKDLSSWRRFTTPAAS